MKRAFVITIITLGTIDCFAVLKNEVEIPESEESGKGMLLLTVLIVVVFLGKLFYDAKKKNT